MKTNSARVTKALQARWPKMLPDILVAATLFFLILVNARAAVLDMHGLLNSVLLNLLAAYVFFVLVVRLPDARKRAVIRNNLRLKYHEFKRAVIGHFVGITNRVIDLELVDRLCDISQFRMYFSEDQKARWYAVMNGIDGNSFLMNEIIVELALFRAELTYVLDNIEIHDRQVFAFLKNLSAAVYRFEQGGVGYEDVKSFMSFMWQLLAGWSWIEGYAETDVVESLIAQI